MIDKQLIAESFGHAAPTYDALAALQKDLGRALLELIDSECFSTIADVGCGTGWMTRLLRNRFPRAAIHALDLSSGMVEFARTHQPEAADDWLVGDMETLPFPDRSLDLVYSNLAMQWLDDPTVWFQEVGRVLKPGGMLICSTLLDGTLQELQDAWAYADSYQQAQSVSSTHVNRFLSLAEMDRCLQRGLPGAVCERQTWVRYYPGVRDIMAELKGIGAHNLNNDRPQGFTGKTRIRQMMHHYERFRCEAGLPTTYQAGMIRYRKP